MKIKCITRNLIGERLVAEFDGNTTLRDVMLRLFSVKCSKENPIYHLVSPIASFKQLAIDGDCVAHHKGVTENTTLYDFERRFGYSDSDDHTIYISRIPKMGGDYRCAVVEDGVLHCQIWCDGAYVDYAGYQDSNGKWYLRKQYVDPCVGTKSRPVYYYDENGIRREISLHEIEIL